jgi:3-phenylpropionate/trans-cinnamate dioxygenase ferredoxin subunit
MSDGWIAVCQADDVEVEDVRRVDFGGRTFVICRNAAGDYFALDGLCSHERAHLADGFVHGDVIECPKHNGRFNIQTGEAVRLPARRKLNTYPTKLEDGRVLVRIDRSEDAG